MKRILCVIALCLFSTLSAQDEEIKPVIFVGPSYVLSWECTGNDVGSGLSHFELLFLDVDGVPIKHYELASTLRSINLNVVTKRASGFRIRTVDNVGNTSAWFSLEAVLVFDREKPDGVTSIDVGPETP